MRTFSPYICAKIVNIELQKEGFPSLPPQMFYTYTKKGYIASFKDEQNKIKVNEIELAKWLQGYLLKKRALASVKADLTSTNIDENQLSLI